MEIEIAKLKEITNLIFDHLRDDVGLEKIELDSDFYWEIGIDKTYDVNLKPDELEIGQLYDDWEFLSEISDKSEAVSLMFVHLAPLMKYIGAKIGR